MRRSFTLGVVLGLLLVGCAPSAPVAPAEPSAGSGGPSAAPLPPDPAPAAATEVVPAGWQLPSALSRPVVLGVTSGLMVAGGLTAGDRSTTATRTYDPATGRTVSTGRLALAVHDAAGAVLSGRALVFGGGDTSVADQVQTPGHQGRGRVVGSLPTPRADLAAVTVPPAPNPTASPGSALGSSVAYLVGGYDGASDTRTVLATTDGTSFRAAGALQVGVRYPAVAANDGVVWVLGGEVNGVPVDLIQRLDLATGTATVAGHLPRPLSAASAFVLGRQVLLAGGVTTGGGRMATVWRLDPGSGHNARVHPVAQLPRGTSDMGAAVVGDTAYLVGGEAPAAVRSVVAVRMSEAIGASAQVSPEPGWLGPSDVPAHLAAGSDPRVLPGPLLIADKLNNRLLVVDPQGRVRWQFPRRGDLRPGQTFRIPDDAFFSPDSRRIIATQEDDSVVSVIDIASHRLVYRYGRPGVPGAGPNRLNNPDDAFLLPGGDIVVADIKNCRLLRIRHGSHRPAQVFGTTGVCGHRPPTLLGSPNGAFPMPNGNYLVTEIQGSYVDEITPAGRIVWSVHLPGVAYPSDSNQVRPGVYVTVDYSSPGQVLEFNARGRVLWRWRPLGTQGLDHPSLARPLPNGDLLVTDDYNHRILVVDPTTNHVVWQYGSTGQAGSAPGLLNNPDGLDLVAPNALINGYPGG